MTGEIVASEPAASRVAAGETVAAAMQLAIGLLTASLDSPELEARALATLMPHDADGLGDFMAGLHAGAQPLIPALPAPPGGPPAAPPHRPPLVPHHTPGT